MITSPSKRTNVRHFSASSVLRGPLRALTLVSPKTTARLAARWFITPRRHPRPVLEQEILQSGQPMIVPIEGPSIVRAWRWGTAPYVLLVHGWEGRGTQLGAFIEPLRRAGYGVVTFDGPAHGDSPGRRSGPPMLGTALLAVARWVGGIHGLVAHSMGALATPWALARGLRVGRIVFIAPGFSPDDATARMAEILDLPPSVLESMREHVGHQAGRPWRTLVDDIMGEIEPPLLVIHDEHDKEVSMAAARYWVDKARNGQLERTTGLGHRRILRSSEVVTKAILFLGPPEVPEPLDPWQKLLHGHFEIERPKDEGLDRERQARESP